MPTTDRLPDLRSLELLVDVARTGSIGAAGRVHGLSQQAASQRLRALESGTGVPLLHRAARGTALTAQGVVLSEWVQRVLEAADDLGAAIAGLRADGRAQLHVAASMTIAEYLLPAWLVAVRAAHTSSGSPPVSVTFTATNTGAVLDLLRTAPADGRSPAVELGFIEGPDAPLDLPSRPVGSDDLVLVVAPGHPWTRRRRSVTPAEVAATPLVTRESSSGTRQVFQRALAEHGLVEAPPLIELTTSTAVREAIRSGIQDAGVLSRLAVRTDLGSGSLVAVPVAGLDTRRLLRAVWRTGDQPPAGAARELLAVAVARPVRPGSGR